MATDLSPLVATLQEQNRLLAKLQQSMGGNGPVALPNYAVASLPTSAPVGAMAYATDGRKPTESAGAGTGVSVTFDRSGVWFATTSGAAVTA